MIKIVLSNGEGDELELGPFSQGIVFDPGLNLLTTVARIFDVASGREIVRARSSTSSAAVCYPMDGLIPTARAYKSLFVHQVPLDEQRRLAWAELNYLVATGGPHCPAVRCEEHEQCIKIDLARERVNYLGTPIDVY